MNLLVCPLLCLTAALSTVPEPEHWAQRLSHNDPNLVVDLGVGLWALPLPMDYDGDGDMDLMVSCADVPARGLHYFENEGNGVFAPGVLLDTEKRIFEHRRVVYDVAATQEKMRAADLSKRLIARLEFGW